MDNANSNTIKNTLVYFILLNIVMFPVHYITLIGMALSTDSGTNETSAYILKDVGNFLESTTLLFSFLIIAYIIGFFFLMATKSNKSKCLYLVLSMCVLGFYYLQMATIHVNFDRDYVQQRSQQIYYIR